MRNILRYRIIMNDEITVFVPGHITGFFSIYENNDLLQYGSKGLGLLIDEGVKTTIKLSEDLKSDYEITINKIQKKENETIIRNTIQNLKKQYKIPENLKITQKIQTPIGSGFGTSAASSLSTTIAIKTLLNLPMSKNQAGQNAHLTELQLQTGLGDVIAQTGKGLIERTKPGAPGYGKIENIPTPQNLYIITKTINKIETQTILENKEKEKLIKQEGKKAQENFNREKTIQNFIKQSQNFTKNTNLLNPEIEEIIKDLNKQTKGASMALIGNTAFAITKHPEKINPKDYKIHKLYKGGIKIDKNIL